MVRQWNTKVLLRGCRTGRHTWHKGFLPANEIWLKIGGDKGGGTFKMTFQIVNVATQKRKTLLLWIFWSNLLQKRNQWSNHYTTGTIVFKLVQYRKQKWWNAQQLWKEGTPISKMAPEKLPHWSGEVAGLVSKLIATFSLYGQCHNICDQNFIAAQAHALDQVGKQRSVYM